MRRSAHSPVLRTLLVVALLASYAMQGLLPLVRDVAHLADHARERTRASAFQVERPLGVASLHEHVGDDDETSHGHAPGHDHDHPHDSGAKEVHVHAPKGPPAHPHDHGGLAGILLALAPELDPADQLEPDRPPIRVAIDLHLMPDTPLDAPIPRFDDRSEGASLDRPATGTPLPPPLPPPRA